MGQAMNGALPWRNHAAVPDSSKRQRPAGHRTRRQVTAAAAPPRNMAFPSQSQRSPKPGSASSEIGSFTTKIQPEYCLNTPRKTKRYDRKSARSGRPIFVSHPLGVVERPGSVVMTQQFFYSIEQQKTGLNKRLQSVPRHTFPGCRKTSKIHIAAPI